MTSAPARVRYGTGCSLVVRSIQPAARSARRSATIHSGARSLSSPNVERLVNPNLRVFSESTPFSMSLIATSPARFCARATAESAFFTTRVVSATTASLSSAAAPSSATHTSQ